MPGPDRASHVPSVMPDLIGHLFSPSRGRELGPSGHEAAGAPDAVPPLAPTMSLTTRGRRGTPQLDAHPSGGNSPQLSPFALAREPVVPATRSILRLLRPSDPTPVPGLRFWATCDATALDLPPLPPCTEWRKCALTQAREGPGDNKITREGIHGLFGGTN
jgi:hypothetical protein